MFKKSIWKCGVFRREIRVTKIWFLVSCKWGQPQTTTYKYTSTAQPPHLPGNVDPPSNFMKIYSKYWLNENVDNKLY